MAAACPAIRVVFLSSHNDEEAKLSSILAGADAYLLKDIGVELGLSHKTVKNYLSNVYQKLQVPRRSQVAAMFARNRD